MQKKTKIMRNPFFGDFETPFGVPPFDQIKEDHYMPAFQEGMKMQMEEIESIVNNTETPTFENTIEALETSGTLLKKVSRVFSVLNASMTNKQMQAIAKEVAPLKSKHFDDILLNEKLFDRVKTVYDELDGLNLTAEQERLLEKTYKDFVRGGINLEEEKKVRLRKINKFGENILEEENRFEMVIDGEEDLAGLPPTAITAAAEAAKERGYDGKWIFTLHKPSMIPLLQYSDKRNLRERIFKAYISRGDHDDELDNKDILSRIVALRTEKAYLLGYKTFAHYVLEEKMAKQPEEVYELLDQLWPSALEMAKKEAQDLQALINEEGNDFKLQPWDWWYYAEKLKKARYDLDDSILRPYFKLENVVNGAFALADKLFDIQFIERTDIPKYHPDARVFDVQEADGTHIGLLYTDYFPRASKRSGAWMNHFRKQSRKVGKEIHPIITNNGNFSKPTADQPALLSAEEVLTLFHEFGHGLHGLLSNCTYNRLSGTSVPSDFVELPSQIMENWVFEPEVLKMYARHYETDEVIPQELIDKLKRAKLFNQGFAAVEYLAASYLDMDWHTLTEAKAIDPEKFEEASMNRIGLIPEIVVRYKSPYFKHIFTSGYSAGYYSYVWAEVLDADAFEAFRETNIFDKETARAYRENILERGGADDPMVLYKSFRGREPRVEPLLKRKGFIK
jgi:peptidyl-dipeptidase Dcp